MKRNEWNEGLDHLAPDVVESYVTKKDKLAQTKKKHAVWIRFGAIAACFAIIVGTVFAIPLLRTGEDTNGAPAIFEPIVQTLDGLNGKFVVGSTLDVHQSGYDHYVSVIPEDYIPDFEFNMENDSFIVKARVVKNHPDVYNELGLHSSNQPTSYRLIQMETLQTIRGKNMPQYFLYLIPESLYADMSAYDSLLISVAQHRTENHTFKNISKNQLEAFPIPVFRDSEYYWTDFGHIIAFRDGVFDESLWQNEAWRDGYQWGAKPYLDDPETGNHVVRRGDTERKVIKEIERKMELAHIPSAISLQFTSQEAKAAVEYIKPFANGVFVQTSCSSYSLDFTRYVNGFQTEETVSINVKTEAVTYSTVRYTAEDIGKLQNIGVPLLEKAKEYEANFPAPPHTDTSGKQLVALNLCGWYAKVNGKLYGVIKTAWKYQDEDAGDFYEEYYDDAYILYDMENETVTEIAREDLRKIVGSRNVSYTPYEGDTPNPCD